MARPVRLEFPGALWYVSSRAVEEEEIFRDEEDLARWFEVLSGAALMMRWRIHAHVALPSRYELLVETPEPNLATGMRQLNGIYTQAFNRRHDRSGAIFQGRYRSVLVERAPFFLPVVRAIVLAPLLEGVTTRLDHFRASSYRATALLEPGPEWLVLDDTLHSFDAASRRKAGEAFRKYVREGKRQSPPWDEIRGQIFLGSESFRQRMLKLASGKAPSRARSSRGRKVWRPEVRAIVHAVATVMKSSEVLIETERGGEARTMVAFLARHDAALPLAEIGKTLGLGEAAVSRLAGDGRRSMEDEPAFARKVSRVRSLLAPQ